MAIFIMMNNYFHDVATAFLLASAITLMVLAKAAENRDSTVAAFFVETYGKLTFMARLALAWIFWGGVIRTWSYMKYEWSSGVGANQIPAIIVKHILIFAVVTAGIIYWRKLSKRVRAIKTNLIPDPPDGMSANESPSEEVLQTK